MADFDEVKEHIIKQFHVAIDALESTEDILGMVVHITAINDMMNRINLTFEEQMTVIIQAGYAKIKEVTEGEE